MASTGKSGLAESVKVIGISKKRTESTSSSNSITSHNSSSSSSSDKTSSSSSSSSSYRGSVSNSEYFENDTGMDFLQNFKSTCNSCLEENYMQQRISVEQARQRSYLHGSFGPYQSLLGGLELKRTLPDGFLKVFIGTWNMNGKTPPSMLEDLLLPTPLQSIPDLVVIGTQESNGDRDEWEICLQETLGPSHVLFHSVELGTLHLALFLRRDLIWVCSVPESDSLSTRTGSAFRTKGAVSVGFSVFGTSFLFINCHLTAHAEKVKEREKDLKKIFHNIDLPKELPLRRKHKDVTNNYDIVFLCGDLNFRINKPREEVIKVVADRWGPGRVDDPVKAKSVKDADYLLQSDQLRKCLEQNRLLRSFHEASIKFAPTYKYIPGSQAFDDSTKQRVPSYTDRILWKERKNYSITCEHYDSVPRLQSSDHFPVWADFKVPVKPGKETVPLAAGTFQRHIYLEGMKRRVQAWDPNKQSGSSSSSCSLQ